MITQRIHDALNEQINIEFNSSHTYLGMATYCERNSYRGASSWCRLQSREEYAHGMKLYDFLLARDCDVNLDLIVKPATHFESLLQVFEKALAQEEQVTERINTLYETAFQERAFATLVELQWFLSEQVEEEKSVRDVVRQLQMVENDPSGILEIDRELGARTTVA
jgi:ferritin